MRKIILYMLIVLLFNMRSLTLLAQPEPQYYKAAPNFLLSVLDSNSPAEVIKTALTLDYNNEEYSKTFTGINKNDTIGCTISAKYSILNPTEESIKVRMALPFVSTLQNYNPNDFKITVDGKATSVGLLIGEDVSLYSQIDLETVKIPIDSTKNKLRSDHKGKLYVFKVKSQCNRTATFGLKFNELKKSPIFSYGFYDDIGNNLSNYDLFSPINPNESKEFQLFALDGDVGYTYECLLDKESNGTSVDYTNPTNDYTCNITTSECTIMDFILQNEREIANQYISDEQVYSTTLNDLTVTGLDDTIYQLPKKGYSNELSNEKLMMITFEAEISPQNAKEIEVVYTVPCSSKIINKHDIYTFDYVFLTDAGWADFNDIQLVIKTSRKAPYIISSNMEYEKVEDSVYSVRLDKLPNYNLSVQFSDKQYQSHNEQNESKPLLRLGVISIITIIMTIRVIKQKKHK